MADEPLQVSVRQETLPPNRCMVPRVQRTSLIQPEQIQQVILLISGQRVMLDCDLAAL